LDEYAFYGLPALKQIVLTGNPLVPGLHPSQFWGLFSFTISGQDVWVNTGTTPYPPSTTATTTATTTTTTTAETVTQTTASTTRQPLPTYELCDGELVDEITIREFQMYEMQMFEQFVLMQKQLEQQFLLYKNSSQIKTF
jgi:hypothetical protein